VDVSQRLLTALADAAVESLCGKARPSSGSSEEKAKQPAPAFAALLGKTVMLPGDIMRMLKSPQGECQWQEYTTRTTSEHATASAVKSGREEGV